MRAIVRDSFGSADTLRLEDIEKPAVADDGVLVRVRASSVNRGDWYAMTGRPYIGRMEVGFRKPKQRGLGADFAGTVDAVGKDVTEFKTGDEVYGARHGAFAEYVHVRTAVAPKPANLTFEQAAAVPIAALTALQGIRDKGQLQPGQKVLINGASGGVGTFAVQIAKALGGEVTAVCNARHVDLVRSLGADHVIDYTREDFTRSGERYDLMIDIAGSRSWWACRRVLAPQATVVMIGGPKTGRVFGPLGHVIGMKIASMHGTRKVVFFIAKLSRADLDFMRGLLESGKVRPVIDRRYDLSQTVDALRYMGEGHAQGKIVIAV